MARYPWKWESGAHMLAYQQLSNWTLCLFNRWETITSIENLRASVVLDFTGEPTTDLSSTTIILSAFWILILIATGKCSPASHQQNLCLQQKDTTNRCVYNTTPEPKAQRTSQTRHGIDCKNHMTSKSARRLCLEMMGKLRLWYLNSMAA